MHDVCRIEHDEHSQHIEFSDLLEAERMKVTNLPLSYIDSWQHHIMIHDDSVVSRDPLPRIIWPDEVAIERKTKPKCVVPCVCLVLLGVSVAIGVIFGMRQREVPDAPSQSSGDIPDRDALFESCNVDDLLFKCSEGIQDPNSTVPPCLAETYFTYRNNWIHDVDPEFDVSNTDVCEPSNKALMFVALYAQQRIVNEIDLKNIYGLASYFFLLNGENWAASFSWLSDKPVREWEGVEVNDIGEVVEINLRQHAISGTLPSLPALGTLKSLDLSLNMIQGTLPRNLGMLEVLNLENNMFSGTLHEGWTNAIHLRTLQIGYNVLDGTLSSSFGKMTQLEELSIPANKIGSAIPSEIGGCSSLLKLDLRRNSFEGLIPSEIGNLKTLTYLDLGGNSFARGILPEEIFNLTSMVALGLSACSLVGTISPALGDLVALSYVDFYMNDLRGSLPSEVGLLPSMVEMDFSINHLSGTLPSELGRLSNAELIDVSRNLLNGTLPTDLGNLVKLDAFIFSGNVFHGVIPDEICGLWDSGKMQVLGGVLEDIHCSSDMFGGAVCPYPDCCPSC